jgi:EAL domain-containing protein (putative c-di-GMP-specific phosphodiesterase class I)
MVSDPTAAPETIIREADAAMYRAKERGRACYELFDAEARRRALERIELEAAIRRAVEHCELRVHYQPNLILHDLGEVMGVEALVRWRHPRRGLIDAREFMPLAADVGLLVPIGRFVLRHAVTQLARWRARRPDMTISLNISAAQLRDPALPAVLADELDAARLDPAAVCFEIAVHELGEDPTAAVDRLGALKAVGARIAMDDFGASGSALAKLGELPIDALKLHESFIAGIEDSPERASVLAALVELGHALGLAVVVKGVETERQLARVRELGCDAAQGYAIGRPMSEEQLEALLVNEAA